MRVVLENVDVADGLVAAAADAEANADNIALNSVAAWYDVFAYRALVSLAGTFVANQQDLRAAVETRISQGVSAPGDAAQVETYIASAQRRLAIYRRQLANAEARYTELIGEPPPGTLERAPPPIGPAMTRDRAALEAMSSPAARSAQAQADSARQEAKAVKADRLPSLTGGVDAGRYGVFECLEMTEPVRKLIGATTDTGIVEEAAVNDGMTTMIEDAVAKCRAGVTSAAEVLRVTTVR